MPIYTTTSVKALLFRISNQKHAEDCRMGPGVPLDVCTCTPSISAIAQMGLIAIDAGESTGGNTDSAFEPDWSELE